MTKVAINGFGRIGRAVFKNIIRGENDLEVVAINDLANPSILAHLLKYDSVYGPYEKNVKEEGDYLRIDGVKNGIQVRIFSEKDPENLPLKELGVDIVLECTGIFLDYEGAKKHLKAGAKKVIISAPSKDPENIPSYILGINENDYSGEEIIDMGSCTTNCLAPIVKVLNNEYGIESGLINTIHAYTANQNILDGPHKDLRRARAAALNLIPTSTGAARAISRVIPEMEGKLDGLAIRVPVPTVSILDFTCLLKKEVDREEVNYTLKKKSQGEDLRNILGVEDAQLVSSDYVGSSFSAIVDCESTYAKGNLAKVVAWYDNEWGYSKRLAEMARFIKDK